MKSRFLPAAAMLLFLAGCTTSSLTWTPAQPGTRSAAGNQVLYHMHGMNSGIYFLYFLPLWSGSPYHPNWQEYDCFRDRLGEKYVYSLMESRNRQLKTDRVEDISIKWHSSGVWGLWIFWKRWVTASGSAVKIQKK